MTKEEIFQALEKSGEMLSEALRIQNIALSAIFEIACLAENKTNNIVESLASPEKGDILNINDVCNIFKISKSKVYRLLKEGLLPYHKPGNGNIFFFRHEITIFLKQTNYSKKRKQFQFKH